MLNLTNRLFSPIKVLQALFFSWVDIRNPVATTVALNRRNLYIFPSLTGLCVFTLSSILWLLGTSYQNNLVLALSYLLVSLMMVAIFHTYANLAGLTIKVLGVKPVFANETAYFSLQLSAAQHKHYENLTIRWWQGEAACFDLQPGQVLPIQVALDAQKRGILTPGKLLIESRFPLGVIRCWTWVNLQTSAVVFPRPLKVPFPVQLGCGNAGEHGTGGQGMEDFDGLKVYRPGDPIKHIAWKHYAREKGLYSKQYSAQLHQDCWLDWQDFAHFEVEQRLSAICYWVLHFERTQQPYGLIMPDTQIKPAIGEQHRLTVLTLLARFNLARGV
ncbi:DUF58 domain-containing protein [Psychromonas sp. B3M02]|uniref:DUF58 domain-containing protein n=1 Tax=Psychromonas sp. B3M02 TaxID=2267226 RepID=UPI000DEBC79A|nr:DUF58 domain-containing protein [Psychromonas sp. B3M02]RBW47727.1 DUF58 domain-containing protein [Psychromonas sp. B3M02]